MMKYFKRIEKKYKIDGSSHVVKALGDPCVFGVDYILDREQTYKEFTLVLQYIINDCIKRNVNITDIYIDHNPLESSQFIGIYYTTDEEVEE